MYTLLPSRRAEAAQRIPPFLTARSASRLASHVASRQVDLHPPSTYVPSMLFRRAVDTDPQFQRRASPDIALSNAAASERIQWTPHAAATLIQYMRVYHRGADVRMAEQLLYGANVVATLQQMRRKRVA